MIESLINYYKKSARAYSLVFSRIKLQYFLFKISSIFLILSLFIFFAGLTKLGLNLNSIVIILIPCIIFIGLFLWLNNSAKKVVAIYNIHPKGFIWRTSEFEKHQTNLIINYLSEQNLFSENKVKILIEILNKESAKRRIPSFFAPGAFLAMFIPVWVQFTAQTFKLVTNTEIAISTTIGLTGTAFILVLFAGFTKNIIIDIKDLFFNNESYMINQLVRLLEMSLLNINLEKSTSHNTEFPQLRQNE